MVFTTTSKMAEECQRFHTRLAELLSNKKKRTMQLRYHESEQKFPLLSFIEAHYYVSGAHYHHEKKTTDSHAQVNDFEIDMEQAGIS